MLNWTITFLVITILTAIVAFGGIAPAAAGYAKVLFAISFVVLIAILIIGKGKPQL